MDEITKLQDEALLYLRDNITREEAYYILTTDKDMIEVLISDKKDGSKRIKILDMEYTIEKDDMLLLFDTDGGNRRMSFGYQLHRGKYVFSQARCQRYFV